MKALAIIREGKVVEIRTVQDDAPLAFGQALVTVDPMPAHDPAKEIALPGPFVIREGDVRVSWEIAPRLFGPWGLVRELFKRTFRGRRRP